MTTYIFRNNWHRSRNRWELNFGIAKRDWIVVYWLLLCNYKLSATRVTNPQYHQSLQGACSWSWKSSDLLGTMSHEARWRSMGKRYTILQWTPKKMKSGWYQRNQAFSRSTLTVQVGCWTSSILSCLKSSCFGCKCATNNHGILFGFWIRVLYVGVCQRLIVVRLFQLTSGPTLFRKTFRPLFHFSIKLVVNDMGKP